MDGRKRDERRGETRGRTEDGGTDSEKIRDFISSL